jgi:hypothetical protein
MRLDGATKLREALIPGPELANSACVVEYAVRVLVREMRCYKKRNRKYMKI